ncbi:hypothetical protein, partial [Bradyrhizobium sp. 23AC]
QFSLRVDRGDALPVLLFAGVKRIDDTYQAALQAGLLGTGPGLAFVAPTATPTPTDTPSDIGATDAALGAQTGVSGSVVTIQVDTP